MKLQVALLAALVTAGPALAKDIPPEVEFGMPSRDLGKAEGLCRPGESGPALIVTITGLKDRQGLLRLELYPANDEDFLESDKVLRREGKMFHRVEAPLPPSGPVQLCIRTPGPGSYSLSVLHDRDSNRKFGLSTDGVGFGSNPKLSLSKPKAAMALVTSTAGLSDITVRMNYRQGLFSFGPLKDR